MALVVRDAGGFDAEAPVLIVGGGAAGLVAALAAREAGVEPVVIERDAVARGSTALSAGLIPAPGSRWQRAAGIDDSPAAFVADVARKTGGRAGMALAATVAEAAAPTLEWLADRHGLPFSLMADVDFPGHSTRRLHGLPSRSGSELIDRLRNAVERQGIPVLVEARVETLVADEAGTVRVVVAARRGGEERIGCRALILACSGYGGNRDLVARHIPEMRDAMYFGHPGNQGDAVLWGEALGADIRAMSGHQGHASVAHPHGILITWVVIMQGGFQVNAGGERFSDESAGYSEQAAIVLRQPGGVAWNIFDARLAGLARQFEDFRNAEAAGAILTAETMPDLANRAGLPSSLEQAFEATQVAKRAGGVDGFGRRWAGLPPLGPPFHAVRVTGALFHTQGGLAIDAEARVLKAGAGRFANLFAAGGAAVGISGPDASGYLSGNGLMTAVTLGRIAGTSAARMVARR